MRKNLFLLIITVIFSTYELQASGFQINEHGARAMGLGNAFTGLADDPSAVYFNPAGITQLNGTQFSFGATYINPVSTFKGPSPLTTESKLKNQYFTPYNFYFTQSLGSDFWLGFGSYNPFGLGTEWNEDWVGRYRTTKTEIKTFDFSPVIAYKINDQLSVSVGFAVSYADVLIARKVKYIPTGIPANPLIVLPADANLEMKGHNTSFGYSAGILYKPMDKLSLGISFHSSVKYDMKGDAVISNAPDAYLAYLPKGAISAPLNVPMVLSFGASYKPSENLFVNADLQYNGWSSYDKLEVTFNDYKPAGKPYVSTSIRDYKNSFIARLGSEYSFENNLAIRAGLFYDVNPVKDERLDPVLPDANRIGLNIGLGYKLMNNLSVDVSYLHLIFAEREINSSEEIIPVSITNLKQQWNGTYNISANLISLGLTYSL